MLLLATVTARAEPPDRTTFEAEDLTDGAEIVNGGDLLKIASPDDGRFEFSGGWAISFVPRGKGSALDLNLHLDEPGIYRVRLVGVMGPSCGIYDFWHNGRERGSANFSEETTIHMKDHPRRNWGISTKRLALVAGDNRVRFRYTGAPRRGGNLVLDLFILERHKPQPFAGEITPSVDALPANETLGPDVLQNGDFEAFGPNDRLDEPHRNVRGWRLLTVPPRKHRYIIDDAEQAHAGQYALRLVPDPLEDNASVYTADFPATNGKWYRLSLHAKGHGPFTCAIYQPRHASADDAKGLWMNFEPDQQWSLFTNAFLLSPSSRIETVRLFVFVYEGSDVYLDDVSVREVLSPVPPTDAKD